MLPALFSLGQAMAVGCEPEWKQVSPVLLVVSLQSTCDVTSTATVSFHAGVGCCRGLVLTSLVWKGLGVG